MKILGISAFYHDSAAALVVDGKIVAAAQEERFTRRKHDHAFPVQALRYCLREAATDESELDYVVFYEKPLLKFERLLETYLAFAPQGFGSFCKALPLWLKQKLHLKREIRRGLRGRFTGPIVFTDHHESHAASAFYPSPFAEAAIVTIDGVGEWATASIGQGSGNDVKLLRDLRFPHSLGLLYSAFTYYCGFRVNSGEYKLMGLAPYGRPQYVDRIYEHLLQLHDDGSLWMDMRYFNYCQGLTMTNRRFDELFGAPRRSQESELSQFYMDMAASVQAVTEEAMLRMCRQARELTGMRNLCLAGGVALNCVGNGKILRSGEFERIWIQPAAGDAGGALGAALFVWYRLLENPRQPEAPDGQQGSYLGPAYSRDEIRRFLETTNARYELIEDEKQLLERVAQAMVAGAVVGWFHGRMEFGPRALGARSIIGDARSERMQSTMNLKIKYRESFRPFAPCVLAEKTADYFDLDCESPYMLLVAPVCESQRAVLSNAERQVMDSGSIRERVHVQRSTIPAVTHVDYSARVQTVDSHRHDRYYRLIQRFAELTDCPVIINTSFNIRGEPIVGAPEDAFNCFMNTEMDILVLENYLLLKEQQPEQTRTDQQAYREEFPLD